MGLSGALHIHIGEEVIYLANWDTLKDKEGNELGSDIVLSETQFLRFQVVENPSNKVRYLQMRLHVLANGTWKQVWGDVGLTLPQELANLYSDHMTEIAEAITELLPVVTTVQKAKELASSGGPRRSGRTS
jgi:hypothetical protein